MRFVLLVLLLGIIGGFLSGLFGVSSGVIITPSLCFLGIPPMIAISSQLNNVIATDLIGFLGCLRKGSVDISLACYLLLGGVLGAWHEHAILNYLQESDLMDVYEKNISWVYAVFLGILGCISFKTSRLPSSAQSVVSMRPWMTYVPMHRVFVRSRAEISILLLICLGWVTGVLTATLGGGNSLILIPVLTYLIGRVSSSTMGTSFLAGVGITTAVILFHGQLALFNPWISCLLIVGTSVGAPLGLELGTRYRKKSLALGRSLLIFALFFWTCITILSKASPSPQHHESAGILYTCLGAISSMILAFFLEKTLSSYLRRKIKGSEVM